MARHLVPRRVLLAALVGTVGAACTRRLGSPPGRRLPDHTDRQADKEATILDLSFTEHLRYRPFDLVAPSFTAVSREAVGPTAGLDRSGESPPAPFAAVEVEVRSATGVVVAGLGTADGHHLAAVYDPGRRRIAISLQTRGRSRLLRRARVDLPESFTLGFVVCENQVTLLARTDAWRPVLTERRRVARHLDLRDPATLGRFSYLWGVEPGSGPADLGAVRAGLFGMTGLRDPHLVQHADGRPYLRDGKAYLTFTCAGLGFFQQAHWGVFSLDLEDPRRLEQVAQLYTLRQGLLLGDHAGQIVRDDEHDRWLVATSSWGDFAFRGVHVRHVATTADVLAGVHVLETQRTPLPTGMDSWDPGMTRVDGRWQVAFVESPSQQPFDFHPALARGPRGAVSWHDGLELVGAATDLHECEGPLIEQVDGDWWLLASDGIAREYPVFDLSMRRVGSLDAPYPSNIPHPQIIPLPDGGHLLVTFDGTQYAEPVMGYGGHGDVVVMRATRPDPA